MSSRIIRADERLVKSNVRSIAFESDQSTAAAHENQLRNAERQGFERGFREGEQVGRQLGEQMIETTAKRYELGVAELTKAHAEICRAMETKTVELALEIARKVIQREISTDPDLVCALAMVALKRVHSHQTITLRVNHHDFPRIQDAVASVNGSVSVVEDPGLERGDFLIDTANTHLDGRLQSQVDTLGRAILAE